MSDGCASASVSSLTHGRYMRHSVAFLVTLCSALRASYRQFVHARTVAQLEATFFDLGPSVPHSRSAPSTRLVARYRPRRGVFSRRALDSLLHG